MKTASRLIQDFAEWLLKQTGSVAYLLHIKDVRYLIEMAELEDELSDKECIIILMNAVANADYTYGVSLDDIEAEIDTYLQGRAKNGGQP